VIRFPAADALPPLAAAAVAPPLSGAIVIIIVYLVYTLLTAGGIRFVSSALLPECHH